DMENTFEFSLLIRDEGESGATENCNKYQQREKDQRLDEPGSHCVLKNNNQLLMLEYDKNRR
ncbi:MAG: hypothetical protein AAEJ65_09325, partial [Planctomycetota bacterium]